MIAVTSSPKDSTSWHEYYWTLKNSLRRHRIPLCTRWRQRSFGRLSLSCLNHHAYVSDRCSCSCWCWVLCKVGHNFAIMIIDSVIPSSLHQAREWKCSGIFNNPDPYPLNPPSFPLPFQKVLLFSLLCHGILSLPHILYCSTVSDIYPERDIFKLPQCGSWCLKGSWLMGDGF